MFIASSGRQFEIVKETEYYVAFRNIDNNILSKKAIRDDGLYCIKYSPFECEHIINVNKPMPKRIINGITTIDGVSSKEYFRYIKNKNGNRKSVSIPNGIKRIEFSVFKNHRKLESLFMPDTVSTLDIQTFENCVKLKDITLSNNIKVIPMLCFAHCNDLENLEFPKSLREIGRYAFIGCNSLKVLNIPNSITYIGNCAFKGCISLEEVYLPYRYVELGKNVFRHCQNLRKVYMSKENFDMLIYNPSIFMECPNDLEIIVY